MLHTMRVCKCTILTLGVLFLATFASASKANWRCPSTYSSTGAGATPPTFLVCACAFAGGLKSVRVYLGCVSAELSALYEGKELWLGRGRCVACMVKAPEQNAFEKRDVEACKLASADEGLSAVGDGDE
jgi:hypothetical protein